MIAPFIFSFVALTGGTLLKLYSPYERIVNGQKALQNQFPFQAFIVLQNDTVQRTCGGSIITSRHIMTAAHCLES